MSKFSHLTGVQQEGTRVPNHEPHPGTKWLDANRATLPDDEWVAADGTGLVANAPTVEGLLSQLHGKGLTPGDVTIEFNTSRGIA